MWNVVLSIGLALGSVRQDSTVNPEFALLLKRAYRHSVPTVSVSELKSMIKRGAIVLDAREQEEFEISHIKRARHVGYIWFDMRKVYDIPKTDTVVVYCAIGKRSERIGEKLQRAGYQHVYNLFGGIYEWANQRNPVYNCSNIQTTEVHIYDDDWSRWLENASRVY
ncbi:rhodanese-like domain-containing protein [Parapedobacter deserti]|uniref:Rhodanese-like domain-containing protein n=1 Tax=Parapedobacter deserti TaxID=1912957 RepID=A0ABV7JQ03_9SPHI